MFTGEEALKPFVRSIIQNIKPVVVAVNGMSIGIGCTILALFDFVYSVESAVFTTPFLKTA